MPTASFPSLAALCLRHQQAIFSGFDFMERRVFVALCEEVENPSESPQSCRGSEVSSARLQMSDPAETRLYVFGRTIREPAQVLLARAILCGLSEDFFQQGVACFYRGQLHPAVLAWGLSSYSRASPGASPEDMPYPAGFSEADSILAGIYRDHRFLSPPGLVAMRKLSREFSGVGLPRPGKTIDHAPACTHARASL